MTTEPTNFANLRNISSLQLKDEDMIRAIEEGSIELDSIRPTELCNMSDKLFSLLQIKGVIPLPETIGSLPVSINIQ